MSRRILITGAFGQLGEAVIHELHPHFELTATGLSVPENFSHNCDTATLDITDRTSTRNCVKKIDPDVVVHLASHTNVDGCEQNKEKAWQVNVVGTENLVDSIRETSAKFILISSDYIFNGKSGPYDESAIPDPINYYGKTKLAAENAVRGSGSHWVIIRTIVLYGKSSKSESSFVNWVVSSLEASKNITVVNDQWGNPTWTGGLAEAIKMSIILDIRGIFNYGGAEYLTRFEFARKIAEVFSLDVSLISPTTTETLGQAAPRPLKSGLVTEKVEEILGLRTYSTGYCLRKVKEGIVV
ncbi:MAG: NAD(P)-dependent oxidoreductase [Candidatus Marinimicrobia bacterium]|jgi:dTDP-4-dehydrorhamnose reductase|nr:NAD(P)-dependent oxidoreductase [Candidatus Neomarinimicrobiota bacterium]|tara:strand:- start:5180 stop:6073 length:894 start_codon:yes stop_codon:yes gene_type:complete